MKDDHMNRLIQNCLDDYYDDVLNFMFLRVGNRQEAEDLTQETFLKLVESIPSYRQDSTLKTYLFSIAKHTLVDSYDKKSRRQRLMEKIKRNLPFTKYAQNSFKHAELLMLLDHLTNEERELIILKYYLGFSYKEISEITNLSTSHVGVKLSRAKEKLETLKKEGGDVHESF